MNVLVEVAIRFQTAFFSSHKIITHKKQVRRNYHHAMLEINYSSSWGSCMQLKTKTTHMLILWHATLQVVVHRPSAFATYGFCPGAIDSKILPNCLLIWRNRMTEIETGFLLKLFSVENHQSKSHSDLRVVQSSMVNVKMDLPCLLPPLEVLFRLLVPFI